MRLLSSADGEKVFKLEVINAKGSEVRLRELSESLAVKFSLEPLKRQSTIMISAYYFSDMGLDLEARYLSMRSIVSSAIMEI